MNSNSQIYRLPTFESYVLCVLCPFLPANNFGKCDKKSSSSDSSSTEDRTIQRLFNCHLLLSHTPSQLVIIGRSTSDLLVELMNIWNVQNVQAIKDGQKRIVMDVE
jgi:hypothetical protein